MSGSGLIYVAVLGAWAMYVLAQCLRTQPIDTETAAEGNVLRRRHIPELPEGGYTMLRPEAAQQDEPVVKARRVDPPTPVGAMRRVPTSRATARRRRRSLLTLTAIFVMAAAAAGFGVLPWWSPVLGALLLGMYLSELRSQVRRARKLHVAVIPAQRTAESHRRGVRAARRRGEDVDLDLWPSMSTPEPVTGALDGVEAGWEPRPVPLPTYVTAARAPSAGDAAGSSQAGRRSDVSSGRSWTAADGEDTQELPMLAVLADGSIEVVTAELDDTGELAMVFEHKRAANQ
ncbi:MAG: hypothetical protein ACT4PP_05925 [Sporichthyaceae bacterium]